MALAKISKFRLFTLTSLIDLSMKRLQALKIAEIENSSREEEFSTAEIDRINIKIGQIYDALKISEKYPAHKPEEQKAPHNLEARIIEADKKLQDLMADNREAEKEINDILPFEASNYPLSNTETQNVSACHGYITGELPEDNENIFIQILKKDKSKTYVWMLKKRTAPQIPNFNDFQKPVNLPPREFLQKLRLKIETNNKEIKLLENKLSELCAYKQWFRLKKLLKQKELAEEKQKLLKTGKVSVISGYILSKNSKLLKKEFPEAFIEFMDAGPDAPVAFTNNPVVSPVEGITESYTMPSSHDIDPNPVMAFFYYLFFGMMFSDAGYGLLMILVCGYAGFFMKTKIKKMLQMFFFCGISTFFWGLMYGGFFGNAITSVGEIFFGRTLILRPLWINPTQEPLTLLIFSIALGFLQIITGLCIKLFIEIKSGRIKDGIFDTGSWILTLSGLGILSAGIAVRPLLPTGIFISITGVLMLIATQGRNKKNIFLKISGGVLSLYNITSYISDILSYSRLMALGLATGVIAEVVNILGGLGGNSAVGVIMYILIFTVGHCLNFAINMLGAYVHTNRLQYVEFYSKFYEGGGRAFTPFGSRY